MGRYDYLQSLEISGATFAALIMAAMRKADWENLAKLKREWPEIAVEFDARYDAPGGRLEGEA